MKASIPSGNSNDSDEFFEIIIDDDSSVEEIDDCIRKLKKMQGSKSQTLLAELRRARKRRVLFDNINEYGEAYIFFGDKIKEILEQDVLSVTPHDIFNFVNTFKENREIVTEGNPNDYILKLLNLIIQDKENNPGKGKCFYDVTAFNSIISAAIQIIRECYDGDEADKLDYYVSLVGMNNFDSAVEYYSNTIKSIFKRYFSSVDVPYDHEKFRISQMADIENLDEIVDLYFNKILEKYDISEDVLEQKILDYRDELKALIGDFFKTFPTSFDNIFSVIQQVNSETFVSKNTLFSNLRSNIENILSDMTSLIDQNYDQIRKTSEIKMKRNELSQNYGELIELLNISIPEITAGCSIDDVYDELNRISGKLTMINDAYNMIIHYLTTVGVASYVAKEIADSMVSYDLEAKDYCKLLADKLVEYVMPRVSNCFNSTSKKLEKYVKDKLYIIVKDNKDLDINSFLRDCYNDNFDLILKDKDNKKIIRYYFLLSNDVYKYLKTEVDEIIKVGITKVLEYLLDVDDAYHNRCSYLEKIIMFVNDKDFNSFEEALREFVSLFPDYEESTLRYIKSYIKTKPDSGLYCNFINFISNFEEGNSEIEDEFDQEKTYQNGSYIILTDEVLSYIYNESNIMIDFGNKTSNFYEFIRNSLNYLIYNSFVGFESAAQFKLRNGNFTANVKTTTIPNIMKLSNGGGLARLLYFGPLTDLQVIAKVFLRPTEGDNGRGGYGSILDNITNTVSNMESYESECPYSDYRKTGYERLHFIYDKCLRETVRLYKMLHEKIGNLSDRDLEFDNKMLVLEFAKFYNEFDKCLDNKQINSSDASRLQREVKDLIESSEISMSQVEEMKKYLLK